MNRAEGVARNLWPGPAHSSDMKNTTLAILFAAISLNAFAEPRPLTAADAKALFARFQSLAGTWKGKSTKGWTETAVYEVVARGSVVITRSHFDGEPNDGMLTTIFLDGDRLLLTHYCEARNQPTLVASEVDDGSHSVVFRFLRATNLPTRDTGHMDACVISLTDDDHLTERWTWYANGKETWLETIEQERSR